MNLNANFYYNIFYSTFLSSFTNLGLDLFYIARILKTSYMYALYLHTQHLPLILCVILLNMSAVI